MVEYDDRAVHEAKVAEERRAARRARESESARERSPTRPAATRAGTSSPQLKPVYPP
jgi:hypothetical protein